MLSVNSYWLGIAADSRTPDHLHRLQSGLGAAQADVGSFYKSRRSTLSLFSSMQACMLLQILAFKADATTPPINVTINQTGIAWKADRQQNFGAQHASNFNAEPVYRGGATVAGDNRTTTSLKLAIRFGMSSSRRQGPKPMHH